MADLDALIIFAKVAEAMSFSEAARRLKMPLSTVSRRIVELENQLGVRLLDRSTRGLRLTGVGADILEHAQRSAELSESVDSLVSNQISNVTGLLRLSAPPSISDTLLVPLLGAFQTSYPDVRVEVFISDRYVDFISEGVELVFRLGPLKDSSLLARRILSYRHRLVASPAYLARCDAPQMPQDLLGHRLLGFAKGTREKTWVFNHADSGDRIALSFRPCLSMNDYSGLAAAILAGGGIGDLPPVVRPDLLLDGRLVEIMPQWRFRTFDLSLVHLGNRHVSRPVRVFKEFAVQMAPRLFPALPS